MLDKEVKDFIGKLLQFCAYQDRFEVEVIEKLKKLGIEETEVISKAIQYLKNEKYLDEKRAAVSYARGRILLKKWSKMKVEYNLKFMKVSQSAIEEALNEIEDDDYLKIIKKRMEEKIKNNSKLPIQHQKIKVTKTMTAEGFEYDLVKQAWEELKE
ncbi:MAG: RecX family transcriptional regulator [Cytophagales bacterium]